MVFNSIPFAIFFICFFSLYWFFFNRNLKSQNLLILFGSYLFYAWWDWRFLTLLIGYSVLYYVLGIYIDKSKNNRNRKFLIFIGLLQGLGGLVFFKYYNFFVTSLADAFAYFNIHLETRTLKIILPLGISFYTFRLISYLLDIYKGKIKPTRDWIVFFSHVSFFPSLTSGPIDRANLLIPQLEKKRIFDDKQGINGIRQILWGLFCKVVIADNCAVIVNQIFDNYYKSSASILFLGGFLFTIQLYADFSGYSDMAIGFARLLGIKITRNFNFPFFSQNIAEYWRRWHISMTSWFTDYVFTPLSIFFRDRGKLGLIIAILITFTAIGIWHGANWTYVLFGLLHGCYFIPLILKGTMNKRKRISNHKLIPSFSEFRSIIGTFILVLFTNIIFRADSVPDALNYLRRIILLKSGVFKVQVGFDVVIFIIILFFVEWINRESEYGFQLQFSNRVVRFSAYFIITFLIVAYFNLTQQDYIYFHF